MSEFIERMLEREIDQINDHLPEATVTLSELRDTECPSYRTRGGEVSSFRPTEIEYLLENVPVLYHGGFRVPIVVLRRMDLGSGIYTIAGAKSVLFLIGKIVGYVDLTWDEITSWKPIDRLARPQVQVLRRKLPSTTCIGYGGVPGIGRDDQST